MPTLFCSNLQFLHAAADYTDTAVFTLPQLLKQKQQQQTDKMWMLSKVVLKQQYVHMYL